MRGGLGGNSIFSGSEAPNDLGGGLGGWWSALSPYEDLFEGLRYHPPFDDGHMDMVYTSWVQTPICMCSGTSSFWIPSFLTDFHRIFRPLSQIHFFPLDPPPTPDFQPKNNSNRNPKQSIPYFDELCTIRYSIAIQRGSEQE